MNELKIFENSEFGKIGIIEIDGKLYFAAKKCAQILGHTNPERAIREFCKGVTETVTPTNGGMQAIKIIPEGDLYRLVARSKLPSAEKFERWVFDEVLPRSKFLSFDGMGELFCAGNGLKSPPPKYATGTDLKLYDFLLSSSIRSTGNSAY